MNIFGYWFLSICLTTWCINGDGRVGEKEQRLCKIIITRVKVHFADVFDVQLKQYDSVFGNIKPCFTHW